jgi:hypothetical protein
MLPVSIRAPVLAGVAAVSSRPDYWITELVSAAAASAQAALMHCIRSVPMLGPPIYLWRWAESLMLWGNLETVRPD